MKPRQIKARIEELEQALDIERGAYERLLKDYNRLVGEAETAKAEVDRLRAELAQGRSIPRRREAA
jgi:predicted nuclease with TOPRIM domain